MKRPVDGDRAPLTEDDLAFYERVADAAVISRSEHMAGEVYVYECIDPNGVTSYWITGENDQDCGSFEDALHEGVGRLPKEYAERLGLTCGAITRKGEPCRTTVRIYGDRCKLHDETTS